MLEQYLDRSQYGVGQAKSWAELQAEIASGECRIEMHHDRPLRIVEIACIEVLSPHQEVLIEDRQEFSDGRIRRRKLSGVSEKLHRGESPLAGAKRAIQEELGIDGDLTFEFIGENSEENISLSYPGLNSRYHRYRFRVQLPPAFYQPEYIESQASKKTFFIWTSDRNP
jgi:NUDIX domain